MEADNLKILVSVAKSLIMTKGPSKKTYEKYEEINWSTASENQKAEAARFLLNQIEKGEFAQAVAGKISSQDEAILNVPEYIRKAVIWACGRLPDELPGETGDSGE